MTTFLDVLDAHGIARTDADRLALAAVDGHANAAAQLQASAEAITALFEDAPALRDRILHRMGASEGAPVSFTWANFDALRDLAAWANVFGGGRRRFEASTRRFGRAARFEDHFESAAEYRFLREALLAEFTLPEERSEAPLRSIVDAIRATVRPTATAPLIHRLWTARLVDPNVGFTHASRRTLLLGVAAAIVQHATALPPDTVGLLDRATRGEAELVDVNERGSELYAAEAWPDVAANAIASDLLDRPWTSGYSAGLKRLGYLTAAVPLDRRGGFAEALTRAYEGAVDPNPRTAPLEAQTAPAQLLATRTIDAPEA